jgi:hypothetical protein
MWREDGRLKKRYVKLQDLAAVSAACQARIEAERQSRADAEARRREFRYWKQLMSNNGNWR